MGGKKIISRNGQLNNFGPEHNTAGSQLGQGNLLNGQPKMAFTTYEQGFGVKNNLGSTGKL